MIFKLKTILTDYRDNINTLNYLHSTFFSPKVPENFGAFIEMFYLYIHTKFHPSNSPIPQESQKDDHTMKTKLSLFLATLVCWTGLAQPKISGSYDAPANFYLDIFDSLFAFAAPLYYVDGFAHSSVIQAQGPLTWVNDRFIELHAESPKSIVDRSIKVTQTKSKNADRLTVMLETNTNYNNINTLIVYSTDNDAGCNMSIAMNPTPKNNMHFSAKLPANTTKFYITVTPKSLSSDDISRGEVYLSHLRYNTPIFKVEENISRITIEIPELKLSFFKDYVIEGDYALVKQDTICWRDIMYTKSKYVNAKINRQLLEEQLIKAQKKHLKKRNNFNKHATTVFHIDKPDSLPTNLSGVYYDNTGRRLELFNDKFLFVAHPDSSWQWYDTIYAEATYSREDEQFIQLHAESPYAKIERTIEYSSMIDESKPDSIDFYLNLPNIGKLKLKGKIRAIADFSHTDYYCINFDYSPGDTIQTKLPPGKQILKIELYLAEPITPIPPDSVENIHFGPCNIYLIFIIPEDNTSQYSVTIPGLNPSYFGRYSVNGEYVRIKQDTLIWRGRTFVKSKLPRDIEYIADKEAAQSKDKAPSSDRTTGGQDSPQATPPTHPKSPATK